MSEKRLGMLIDLELCTGCNACTVACKIENDLPLGVRNTWVETWDVVCDDGGIRRANVPKQCNHCADAPCVTVCPTGASYISEEDGTVQLHTERCIGCKYCLVACPYSARWCDPATGEAEKCTFCNHRTSNGLLPACVSTCVTKARIFGDLNDPDSDISKRLKEVEGGDILLEELGCDTALRYVGLKDVESMERVSGVLRGGIVREHLERG